jgi:undecaprenyl-diphosphatase
MQGIGYFQALLLGLAQGLAEFLPISSTGHLVILQYFMRMSNAAENLTFDVFLHLATVLAVILVYRKDLSAIFTKPFVGDETNRIPKWKFVGFIAISIVVTGIAIPFKDILSKQFENVDGVRIFLLINAAALAVLPLLRHGKKQLGEMVWIDAIIIGLAQAVATLPGISRSGATIMAGLLLGLNPKDACRYSFLLSIPTILIAAAVQIPDALAGGFAFQTGPAIVGFATALLAGLVAIPFLTGVAEKGRLWGFAIYCGLLGIALFVFGGPPPAV